MVQSSMQDSQAVSVQPPSLVSSTVGGIMDGIYQFWGKYQFELEKLRRDMVNKFNPQNSINDLLLQPMKWKVENVSRRILEGNSLLSRSFYSCRNGYCMCLKMNFQGDKFILQLVLLRGEYDDDLSWPFKQKVILSVLGNTSVDIYETPTIQPDVQCCRDSYGIVVCCLQAPRCLRPFIIDNCLFMRCSVV